MVFLKEKLLALRLAQFFPIQMYALKITQILKIFFVRGTLTIPIMQNMDTVITGAAGAQVHAKLLFRVFAGAIAKQILASWNIKIRAGLIQVGDVVAKQLDWHNVELNQVRSLDPDSVKLMTKEIEDARKNRNSVGGLLYLEGIGIPAGLGEPVFQKLNAAIGAAMFSIPAVRGVEIGSGFAVVNSTGIENNDEMSKKGFLSNNHGGILGGISSGEPIVVKVAIKPTSSIPSIQKTVNIDNEEQGIVTKGRHDPCVAIRAVPIAEAMLALTIIDFMIEHLGRRALKQAFAPNTQAAKI